MRPARIHTRSYVTTYSSTRYRDIKVQVRRVRLHELLKGLSIVSHKIITSDPSIKDYNPTTFNQWQLACIALASILESDDHRKREMNDYRLEILANIYNALSEDLKSGTDNEARGAYEFLVRLSHMQFPLQLSSSRMMGRALIMFHDIPKSIPHSSIDIPKAITEIYGMTVEDLLTVGVSLMICSKDEGYINREMLENSTIPEVKAMIADGRFEKVMDHLSSTYGDIRKFYDKNPLPKKFEHYAFNILKTKPVVISESGQEIVPMVPFLIERTSMGIYYALMDHFKEPRSNPFLTFFGKEIFEEYIGMQLELFVPKKSLISEFAYGSGSDLTTDWAILDGNRLILIECKTSGLTVEAKTYGNLDKINDELKLRVIHAIEQMLTLREKINKKQKGLERFFKVKKFHFVITTFDDFYLANAPFIRTMIEKHFVDKGTIIDFTYDVVTMSDIESLHAVGKKYNLMDLFDVKHTKQSWIDADMIFYLKEYLPKSDTPLLNEKNPLLEKRRDDYLAYFKQREAAGKKNS